MADEKKRTQVVIGGLYRRKTRNGWLLGAMLTGSVTVEGRASGEMHSYGMRPQLLHADTDELDNWELLASPVPQELLLDLERTAQEARAELQRQEREARIDREDRREALARVLSEVDGMRRELRTLREALERAQEDVRVLRLEARAPQAPLPEPEPEPAGTSASSPLAAIERAKKRVNG